MSQIRKIAVVLSFIAMFLSCVWSAQKFPEAVVSGRSGILRATSPPRGGGGECPFDQFLDAMAARQLATGDLQVMSPPTLKATFLAVQSLKLLQFSGDIDPSAIDAFVRASYDPQTCLFRDSVTNAFEGGMRVCGYSDIEATYYALATLNLVGRFNPSDWAGVAATLSNRYDAASGGFWCRAGVETTHDAYFGCAALRLLGQADLLDSSRVRTFVNAHQFVDPSQWWQVGGFYNIQNDTACDFDFETPNVVTAYYAAATLADRGQLASLDSTDLVQFINMYRNSTTGTFSIGGGYDIAENVGTAYVLALDPYLANPSALNIGTAATALIARLNAGQFREGNSAPLNHMLAAACEMVWGVNATGRLGELTASTNASLRAFICSCYETAGSQGGYAPTNDASLGDIATIVGASGDASRLTGYNIDALNAYVNNTYAAWGPYFLNYGSSYLHCDLPAGFGCTMATGPLSAGIPATLQGLDALDNMGRLNMFLGHLGGPSKILPNVTNSQFQNVSAGASHGAFAPNEFWATLCKTTPSYQALLVPQWTLQALAIIALLDPVNPQAHFNASAAWHYLSQFYVESGTTAYFTPPSYRRASAAEWTATIACTLLEVNMSSYFNLRKVVTWLAANVNQGALGDVARYLDLAAVGGASIPLLALNASALNALQYDLLDPSSMWYHAQGGIWPDVSVVRDLATLRRDQHLYLTPVVPASVPFGGAFDAQVVVQNLFDPTTSGVTVTGTFMGQTSTFTLVGNVFHSLFSAGFDISGGYVAEFTLTASKLGWASSEFHACISLQGILSAALWCGGEAVAAGGTCELVLPTLTVPLLVSLTCTEGTESHPAAVENLCACVSQNAVLVANVTLGETTTNGTYGNNVTLPGGGIFQVNIVAGSQVLASFALNVTSPGDNATGDSGEPAFTTFLPIPVLFFGSAGSVAFLVVGRSVAKRTGVNPLGFSQIRPKHPRRQHDGD